MNKHEFSPFIRVAMYSTLVAPFRINNRILFDYELILVTGGKCKITIDGREYLCKKNDVIFLRPDIHHKFECVDNTNFSQPHIHFDMVYNSKSENRHVSFKPRKAMSQDEINLICDDVFDVPLPPVFTPSDATTFHRIFFEIIELFTKKEYNYELLCKSKMLEILSMIISQFDSNKSSKTDVSSDPAISARNYIDSNFLSVITLDSLSEQFHINKYTLLRKFKMLYGQNIISYYRTRRIEYIKNSLKTTNISITALSEKLGFSDIYSFSRFFKTYVGISPTDYRKNA